MQVRLLVVATAAVLGLLAGCSGAAPAPDPSSAAPSPSSGQSSATPASSSGSPVPSSGGATPATADASAADGKLTWVMPCAKPRDQDIEGNAEDKLTFASFHAWACGQGAATKAGVILAELKKEPADADAAHQQLAAAMKQIVGTGAPTENEFLGHPGVTQQIEQDGRTAGYQGVSFGPYLAFFFAFPAKDLPTLTDTIAIG